MSTTLIFGPLKKGTPVLSLRRSVIVGLELYYSVLRALLAGYNFCSHRGTVEHAFTLSRRAEVCDEDSVGSHFVSLPELQSSAIFPCSQYGVQARAGAGINSCSASCRLVSLCAFLPAREH